MASSALVAAAGVQGFLAFVLEVTWSHLIGTVIGVTVYAFSLMLAAILLGIGLGSAALPLIRRRLDLPPLRLFVWAQVVLAGGVVFSLFLWDRFPDVINGCLWLRPEWSFASRELVRFAFVFLILGPSTLAMGVSLPSLAAVPRASREDTGAAGGAWVGGLFAANTLGAILGSLVGGFGLLGRVESSRILGLVALASLLLGFALLMLARASSGDRAAGHGSRLPVVAMAACLVAWLAHSPWDPARLTSGSHYYWRAWSPREASPPIYLREDAQSGYVSVDRQPDGTRILKTNGKYEGNDAPLEFQDHFALMGALYLKAFDRMALVGLGPGRTLALLHAMPFRKIDVVEFSPAIVEAALQHFPQFVRGPLADRDRVRLVVDDGRNFLQVSSPGYDFIAVGITGAAFAGVGNLYTREFFEVVKDRLQDRGVFLLWVQVHHVRPREVRSVVYTLRRVFNHVHMYATPSGDQGFLLASQSSLEIDPDRVAQLSRIEAIEQPLRRARLRSLVDLTPLNVFTQDAEIAAYLLAGASEGQGAQLLTDAFPAFEYATPRGLAEPLFAFDFQRFSSRSLPAFRPPLGAADEAGLRGLRHMVAGDWQPALAQFERADRLLGVPVWQEQIEAARARLDPAGPATSPDAP